MTDIPASLKITRQEAQERVKVATQGLLDRFGAKQVGYMLHVTGMVVRNWARGTTEPRYSKAIEIIALHDWHCKEKLKQESDTEKTQA